MSGGGPLDRVSVRRVQEALDKARSKAKVQALAATARTARDAAGALGCPLGAIVKSLVFTVDGSPVMALVAGDRQCDTVVLAEALGAAGPIGRADADLVRKSTGFAIGGVAPVALACAMPVVIDVSLGRFDRVFAAAGHPHCVFASTLAELVRLTGGRIVNGLSRTGI